MIPETTLKVLLLWMDVRRNVLLQTAVIAGLCGFHRTAATCFHRAVLLAADQAEAGWK